MNTHKPLTDEQISWLKKHYKTESREVIAQKIGRSWADVKYIVDHTRRKGVKIPKRQTYVRGMTNVKIKRLPHFPKSWGLPAYSTEGSACFDLQATNMSIVPSGGWSTFSTGLAFALPENHVMLIFSRSGHGFKNSVRLSNCVGVIDSDYRGEVKVKLHNDGEQPLMVNAGDRIAQAMVIPIQRVAFTEVDELPETARGKGGFGSTGE